jgi:hypothetical protein
VRTLSVLAGVGFLLAIMGILVFALLGRGAVLCVQWVGTLGEQLRRKPISQRPPPAAPLGCVGG